MSNLTPEERDLFARVGVRSLPWFVRAWLWSLHPVATTRGRITVGVLAGCVVGSATTILVPLVAHAIVSVAR